jgi:hypothetical protein
MWGTGYTTSNFPVRCQQLLRSLQAPVGILWRSFHNLLPPVYCRYMYKYVFSIGLLVLVWETINLSLRCLQFCLHVCVQKWVCHRVYLVEWDLLWPWCTNSDVAFFPPLETKGYGDGKDCRLPASGVCSHSLFFLAVRTRFLSENGSLAVRLLVNFLISYSLQSFWSCFTILSYVFGFDVVRRKRAHSQSNTAFLFATVWSDV